MNCLRLPNWLTAVGLAPYSYPGFGQREAQESEITIVVFLPQQGAKAGESDAAQAQAIALFNGGNHSFSS